MEESYMNVQLLAHTPEPEKVIATAAKLCYSNSDISNLQDSLTEDKVVKFIDTLMSLGHESPVEHVSFTFGIEGISRACSHQLVRHRIASYSQQSQRYVNMNNFNYITPPSIEKYENVHLMYKDVMTYLADHYEAIQSILVDNFMEEFITSGMNEKDARSAAEKKANEDARMILPNACETKIIVTMNIRSLFNFFKHRCCNRAQWEIRAVAMKMWNLCMDVAPNIFRYAGPDCVTKNKCSEGKMSCGTKAIMNHNIKGNIDV